MAELIKNPKVQQKGKEVLDHVIGPNTLMTESDFSNLPYLQCVANQVGRFDRQILVDVSFRFKQSILWSMVTCHYQYESPQFNTT